MKKYLRALLLSASLSPLGTLHGADPFADQVISYTPGTGINSSYETAGVALGAPASAATITAPPFQSTDIVGVGNGGSLVLAFNTPILNSPAGHLFGMDFTIFGNEFFSLSGSTISGSFGHAGLSVWVSQDNVTYYQLAAPYGADDSFPAQGAGDASLPVNPALSLASFPGQTPAQALALYQGSAGGASFSISWAEDTGGNAVHLPSISYIQIKGTSGSGYVDAVSRVADVPEPASLGLLVLGIAGVIPQRRRVGRISKKNPAFAVSTARAFASSNSEAQP